MVRERRHRAVNRKQSVSCIQHRSFMPPMSGDSDSCVNAFFGRAVHEKQSGTNFRHPVSGGDDDVIHAVRTV